MSKETERAALHRTIWQVANDLRGSVDGWDFKAYVLGFLFYRFISENLTDHVNRTEREAGDPDFDYRYLAQEDAEGIRQGLVEEKGFFILPGELFANVRERAARDENLNETLARIFKNIEASAMGGGSENDLRGLFDDVDVWVIIGDLIITTSYDIEVPTGIFGLVCTTILGHIVEFEVLLAH